MDGEWRWAKMRSSGEGVGQLELVCSRGMIGVAGIWDCANQKWMRTQDPRSALYLVHTYVSKEEV